MNNTANNTCFCGSTRLMTIDGNSYHEPYNITDDNITPQTNVVTQQANPNMMKVFTYDLVKGLFIEPVYNLLVFLTQAEPTPVGDVLDNRW